MNIMYCTVQSEKKGKLYNSPIFFSHLPGGGGGGYDAVTPKIVTHHDFLFLLPLLSRLITNLLLGEGDGRGKGHATLIPWAWRRKRGGRRRMRVGEGRQRSISRDSNNPARKGRGRRRRRRTFFLLQLQCHVEMQLGRLLPSTSFQGPFKERNSPISLQFLVREIYLLVEEWLLKCQWWILLVQTAKCLSTLFAHGRLLPHERAMKSVNRG